MANNPDSWIAQLYDAKSNQDQANLTSNLVQWQSQLLEWSSKNPQYIGAIEERIFQLPSGPFHSFCLTSKSPSLGRNFVGIGRSQSRLEAASKAVGEGIERIVGAEVLNQCQTHIGHRSQ